MGDQKATRWRKRGISGHLLYPVERIKYHLWSTYHLSDFDSDSQVSDQ